MIIIIIIIIVIIIMIAPAAVLKLIETVHHDDRSRDTGGVDKMSTLGWLGSATR